MLFSSLFFLYVFLPVLLILYFVIKNEAYRRAVLLLFSLVFYAWGEPLYIFLLLAVVFADYIFGLIIASRKSQSSAKVWLVLTVIANLGILSVYKYAGFLVETVNMTGLISLPVPDIALPIGISFFTFQALTYVVDVYRKDADVQKSYFKLLLYISLFPQLIAGPIVRYKDIADQLDHRRITVAKINDGIYRFAVGLGKKVIIANNCGAAAESLFALGGDITLLSRWMGALFFTLQLYFDFSGYSDMAIGLGKIFGFEFKENFNYPFVSNGATEFWRRWHISLGTFFRDYVYIPLGGNRRHHIRNIFVVWFLTGLWHGASWNFVLWGVYYGILLILEKFVMNPIGEKLPKMLTFFMSKIYFIFITVFGFAIFYFDYDLTKNLGYMFGIGTASFTNLLTNSILMQNVILLCFALILSLPVIPFIGNAIKTLLGRKRAYIIIRLAKTLSIVALISVSTVMMVGNSYNPFLYFRF